jgi:crossover junction endodeoxyribonuclease RusA
VNSDAPATAVLLDPVGSRGNPTAGGRRVSFFVPGTPRPQGSKKGFGRIVPGKFTKKGKQAVAVTMVESSKGLGDWRGRVATFAADAWGHAAPTALPVRVVALFVFRRPPSHYSKAKRNLGQLVKDAPSYPIAKRWGDVEKLERALYDALTGIVLVDDGQVVSPRPDKIFGTPDQPEGVHVVVEEIA